MWNQFIVTITLRYEKPNETLLILIHRTFSILLIFRSSSVGATSLCDSGSFLTLPGQKDNVVRDGSVSPGTSKRERSVSVIAGKKIYNAGIICLTNFE